MAAAGANTFSPRKTSDAPKEFEAFFLQSVIQEMLPKDAEGVYGSGIAGDIWRSMLSEKLAFEVAERGGLGIADQVRASRGLEGSGPAGGAGASNTTGSAPLPQDTAVHETSADSGSPGWRAVVERS
jgi:Rod binding domain-containing protein